MKILSLIHHPKGGCEYYRQITPLEVIECDHEIKGTNYIGEMTDEELKEFDIFHIIRKDLRGDIDRCKKLGLKIVFDIDDYWKLETTHLLYKNYKENNMVEHTIDCIKKADLVLTTQDYLKDKITPYNANVEVLPNLILSNQKQWEVIDKEFDKVRIGWVGGIHHIEDIKLLRDLFQKLWNDDTINDKIQVVLGGYQEQSDIHTFFASVFTGNFNQLAQSNTMLVNAMPVTDFAVTYEMCDIILAPLVDSEFNRCKSALKVIEAGWKNKAVIASNVYPYANLIEHDKDGILIDNRKGHKDWYKYVKQLVLDKDKRNYLKNNLHSKIITNFDAFKYKDKIEGIFRSVIE